MNRMMVCLAMIAAILCGMVACQVYDQSTNGVVYSAMSSKGAEEKESLAKKISDTDVTADLINIAQDYDKTYTGKTESGTPVYKTAVEMRFDILALWDVKYPAKWDFKRK